MKFYPLILAAGISIPLMTELLGSGVDVISQEATGPLPMLAAAKVPLYPRVARATNTEGTIHVRVRTDGYKVVDAHAREDLKPLSTAAEENVKTWEFVMHTPVSFTIIYRYKLAEDCNPDNPTVTLRFPTDIEVCQYPYRTR